MTVNCIQNMNSERAGGAQLLAVLGLVLWTISLFAPTFDNTPGVELAYVSLFGGAEYFFGGTWAALANFALPWASLQLMLKKPARVPVLIMAAVTFSSPLFWSLLFDTTYEGWGVWAWTAAIVVTLASWLSVRKAGHPRS